MKKEKTAEFVYIHKPQYKTITCSSETKFDGDLTIISVKKLTDDAEDDEDDFWYQIPSLSQFLFKGLKMVDTSMTENSNLITITFKYDDWKKNT